MAKSSFKCSKSSCTSINNFALTLIFVYCFYQSTETKLLAQTKSNETLIDRIVAVVNKEPILYSEIQEKIKKGLIYISYYPAKDTDSDEQKAIQDQINFKLIMQHLKDLDIEVSDDEVEAEIKSFLSSKSINMKDLEAFLEQQNMDYEDYKQDFANQMLLRKFQAQVIYPRVKITDKDVEAYYIKKNGSSSENIYVKLRQIYIQNNTGTPIVSQATEKKILDIYQKLKNGIKFEDVAKAYSDDKISAKNGGLMPTVKLSELSSVIKNQISKLNIGEYTEPIRLTNGYYIFYLEEKKFLGNEDFQKQKHIYEAELRNVQMINETQKWLNEQRKKSNIIILN